MVKSRHFDKDRYEFDPNKTWSVLEQGRGFRDVEEADEAVKREMTRLAEERKNLVDSVKKLDEAMLALRAVAGTSPAVAQAVPNVLERLAGVRKSVGVDGPQQLMDFTAPPVDLAAVAASAPAPTLAVPGTLPAPAPALAAPAGRGLTPAERRRPSWRPSPSRRRPLAAMLPLTDLPAGWTVGKSGDRHLETFNAENLYEKINGRAESFIQYDVKGMAYTYLPPRRRRVDRGPGLHLRDGRHAQGAGQVSARRSPTRSSRSTSARTATRSAGSTLFYAGPYYTQIVSTTRRPQVRRLRPGAGPADRRQQKPGGSRPTAWPRHGRGGMAAARTRPRPSPRAVPRPR